MHQIPTDLLAAFIGVYAAFQALTIFLSYMNVAEKRLEGRSTWVAKDGTAFNEFSPTEIEASNILKREFEENTSDANLARASARSHA